MMRPAMGTASEAPKLPPFRTLLKSRDVEDPVNIWLHRPLAYAFVALVFPTPMTPNMITFTAIVAGVASGACFIVGTPAAMIAGGLLLWASAILDGADGILARAKNLQSEFGRAIDGAADSIVAICTVLPAFYHVWVEADRDSTVLWLAAPAIILTLPHLAFYDFYKESYLRMTRPERGGEGEDLAKVEARMASAGKDGTPPVGGVAKLAVTQGLLPLLRSQVQWVTLTNRIALGELRTAKPTPEMAEAYKQHNWWPMQLWTVVSLCPHSYLMAMCAMANRLDVYLWVRLVGMNVMFVIAVLAQRHASARTLEAWRGLAPEASTPSGG